MKKIRTIGALLLCITSWAHADTQRIVLTTPTQGNAHGYTVGTDTGVTIEQGLTLNEQELATILTKKEPLLIREESTFLSWKNLLFARYLVTEQTYAVLEEHHIHQVTKAVSEEQVIYNPFLVSVLLFIVYMLVLYYNKTGFTMNTCYFVILFGFNALNVPQHPLAVITMIAAAGIVVGIMYRSLKREKVTEIRDPLILRQISVVGILFSLIASLATLYGV